jgi:hypothetical protein
LLEREHIGNGCIERINDSFGRAFGGGSGERGKVVGSGTHSELVKSTPLYAELAKHQLLV